MLHYPLSNNGNKQKPKSTNYDSSNAAKDNKQSNIVKRIEELNRWKEEQQKILEDRQNLQRKMLEIEQRNLYGILGLRNEDFNSSELEEVRDIMQRPLIGDGKRHQMSSPTRHCATEDDKTVTSGYVSESYVGGAAVGSGATALQPMEFTSDAVHVKAKKPFLKRGQGLKQRFKIDPEELKLSNLPKYKYANAHPNLRANKFLTKGKDSHGEKQVSSKTTVAAAPQTGILKQRNALMDIQEQRFQQLLINSQNVNSSTPDMKSSLSSSNKSLANSSGSSTLPKVHFAETLPLQQQGNKKSNSPNIDPSPLRNPCISWAKVLDNQQIFQQSVPRKNSPLQHTEEDIFELLEQKANEGSFDMDSSYIKRFLQNKANSHRNKQDMHDIPVSEQIKMKRLQPEINANYMQENSSYLDESYEQQPEVVEQDNTILATETDEEHNNKPENYAAGDSNQSLSPAKPEVRVRFNDSLDTHEYTEESANTLTDTSATSLAGGEGDNTNNEQFEQFKQAIFAVLQNKADDQFLSGGEDTTSNDVTLAAEDTIESNSNFLFVQKATLELQEKTALIKQRLVELEKEIETFKANNIELLKAKQQHEIDKALHAQEHMEAIDRIKDEKIQMEIYLHDERMKMEEEKRKFEQQLNSKHKSMAASENKEREKLRDKIGQLEAQLKAKDNDHMASQSRLRSQIRNLEKEQRKLYDEIDDLKKANKRLENENLRISREQNNKLLQEINRNIAKLAPKVNFIISMFD